MKIVNMLIEILLRAHTITLYGINSDFLQKENIGFQWKENPSIQTWKFDLNLPKLEFLNWSKTP